MLQNREITEAEPLGLWAALKPIQQNHMVIFYFYYRRR